MARTLSIALASALAACAAPSAFIPEGDSNVPHGASVTSTSGNDAGTTVVQDAAAPSGESDSAAPSQNDAGTPPKDAATPPQDSSTPPPEEDAAVPPPDDCPEIHSDWCETDIFPHVYHHGYPLTCVSKYVSFDCAEVTYPAPRTDMYCCK